MLARAIALPVHERAAAGPLECRLLGVTRRAAYLDADGFIVALTSQGVPLMPNGIGLNAWPERLPAVGTRLALRPGAVTAVGRALVSWDPVEPPLWDPLIPVPSDADGALLLRRAATTLAPRLESSQVARVLLQAVAEHSPELAADAAAMLTGRGLGLTPEGDDVLAGVAITVAVLGKAAGFDEELRLSWLDALTLPARAGRTTALSATLLTLAAAGRAAEPMHSLLRPTSGRNSRAAALRRLLAVGHSTGAAYAAAIAAAARAMARGVDLDARQWRPKPLARQQR